MVQGSQSRARVSWQRVLWAVIAAALAMPLIAMQVTDAVAWTAFDFAAAAVLLVGMGLAFELVARSSLTRGPRMALGLGVAGITALVWAQGAVGVF